MPCFSLLATGTQWQDDPGNSMGKEHLYPPPRCGALMGTRVTKESEPKHIQGPPARDSLSHLLLHWDPLTM